MWIPKIAWIQLRHTLDKAQLAAHDRETELATLDGRLLQCQEEGNRLRERLIQAEGDARAHQAYADVWRLQVNTLTAQNAALLTQLVPTLTVPVPTVARDGVRLPAGLDFEDMGDAAATMMGLADEHPLDRGSAPPLGDIPGGSIAAGAPRVPEN